MATRTVRRTYLEMASPDALRPKRVDDARLDVELARPCPVELYRRLYADVGAAFHWRDRLAWSDEELAGYLARPDVFVWVMRHAGETAGYFELRAHDDGSAEIVYFGLVGRFLGRGLGAHMLTRAVEEAWRLAPTRVWLHTCTLDSPHALPNYEARGFRKYREEDYQAEVAE